MILFAYLNQDTCQLTNEDTWDTCQGGDTLSALLAPRVTHCHGPQAKTSFLRAQPSDSSILGDCELLSALLMSCDNTQAIFT